MSISPTNIGKTVLAVKKMYLKVKRGSFFGVVSKKNGLVKLTASDEVVKKFGIVQANIKQTKPF